MTLSAMHVSTRTTPRHVRAIRAAEAILGLLVAAAVVLLTLSREDLTMVRAVHERTFGLGTEVMRWVADLAASETVIGLTVLAALILVARRHWHGALALCVSVTATQVMVAVVKQLVERDRPPGADALVHASGYSFPSAHSATSVAFYGVLALIAAHELRGRVSRSWALAGAAALCVAVGVSRVYLGAHYPTDVLAGWMLGCAIALGSWRGALALRRALPATG
jgi:undecaprenyl-diphosphatase